MPKQQTISNERQLVLKDFIDTINSQRQGYPPIQPNRLGVMLGGIPTKDLKIFFSQCKDAKHFSKFFWWKIKQCKLKET